MPKNTNALKIDENTEKEIKERIKTESLRHIAKSLDVSVSTIKRHLN